jgi:hypothetical protein
VRHRSVGRNAEGLFGEHGRSTGEAGYVTCTGRQQPRFRPMRAPQAEIDQQLSWRGEHHAGGFRCDQRLEMQEIDQPGLHELGLRHRRGDAQDRLIREEDAAFRHSVNVAGEAKIRQAVEQRLLETSRACEPFNFFGGEMEIFEKLQRLFKARSHQESAARRQFAHEELEDRGLGLTMIQVSLDHVHLIKIREQWAA